MFRKIASMAALVLLATSFFFLYDRYGHQYLYKAFLTAVTILAIFVIFQVIEYLISREMAGTKLRFSLRRAATIIYYAAVAIALLAVWVENTRSLLVFSGLIGAGIAVAAQEFFKDLAGGISIFINGLYRIGDRIEVAGKYGDVIDVGIMYTTLLELREWIEGDQPSGRLSTIPNGYVLSNIVNNYTKEYRYIFDEINIPITYESDWKKAADMILDVIRKGTEDATAHAGMDMAYIGSKYYLPRKVVEPAIYITLTDNWISVNARYVTEVRSRRSKHDELSRSILEAIQRSDDVKIASTTIDIVGFPDVGLNKAGKDYPHG
jgi:small-conductance mechanosensitive channel